MGRLVYIKQIVLILFLIALPRAQALPLDGASLNSSFAANYSAAQARLPTEGTSLSALAVCYSALSSVVNSCVAQANSNPYCRKIAMTDLHAPSQVGDPLAAADCYYTLHHCWEHGPESLGKSLSEAANQCLLAVNQTQIPGFPDSSPAVLEFFDKSFSLMDAQTEAWLQSAQASEQAARAKAGAAVECLDHDNGNRVCDWAETDRHLQFLESASAPLAGLDGVSAGNISAIDCSGEALGDGRTFLTAGHCTKNRNSSEPVVVNVFDRDGRSQAVEAHCKLGIFRGVNSEDISVCTLTKTVRSLPTYLAIWDPQVGPGCHTSGWIMHCGLDFFTGIEGITNTVYAYPALSGQNPGFHWVKSESVLHFDKARNSFVFNHWCTGGCSGAGVNIEVQGKHILVGVISWESRFSPSGGATLIRAQDFDAMAGLYF